MFPQHCEDSQFCNLSVYAALPLKTGIVRYNAYNDAGNDLSFAVALLDDKNNGLVFNGIYSREMSNIYAKPIVGGKCKYNMTKEENEALNKAIED